MKQFIKLTNYHGTLSVINVDTIERVIQNYEGMWGSKEYYICLKDGNGYELTSEEAIPIINELTRDNTYSIIRVLRDIYEVIRARMR